MTRRKGRADSLGERFGGSECFNSGNHLHRDAGTLLLATAALLASCGDDTPTEPTALDVRVTYVSPQACCINSCSPPPVLEDILLNGTKLTKLVRDNLPSGLTAALEFTVTGSSTIQN